MGRGPAGDGGAVVGLVGSGGRTGVRGAVGGEFGSVGLSGLESVFFDERLRFERDDFPLSVCFPDVAES